MGLAISKLFAYFFQKEKHILMLGLDAVGKTTILCKLKLEEEIEILVPSMGFYVEAI